jgi:hypothetical protein
VAEAYGIGIDPKAWRAPLQAHRPAGSDAHESYFDRIERGPSYDLVEAVRNEG